MSLKGLDRVVRNLNKEIEKIEGRTLKGFIRAAIKIRQDMDHVSPLIPVDLGNLRSSFFIVTSAGDIEGAIGKFVGEGKGELAQNHIQIVSEYAGVAMGSKRPLLILGFSATYAAMVHEMMGATFQRPNAGAKFLEAAIKNNKDYILRVIREEAQIK